MKSSEHLEQSALFDLLRANEAKHPFLKWVFAVPKYVHCEKCGNVDLLDCDCEG